MIDWQAYRALWPYTATDQVWLQHAGITPPCRRVLDAANGVLEGFVQRPAAGYAALWSGANEGARGQVATFLGTTAEQVALVKNTSQGVLFVAGGLAWQAGQNVVTLAAEYPANRLPWRVAEGLGAELRTVQPVAGGRFPVDTIAAAVDHGTRVVAVSWVQYLNGFRCDLPALAEVCHRVGAFLVVDGVQGVGALPVPLDCVDALAVGGHKWLCGVEGAGFLYLSPRLLNALQPRQVSWKSVATDLSTPGAEVAVEPGLPPLKAGAERLEEGTPNCWGNIALGAAVTMLHEIGAAAIAARHQELQGYLLDHLAGLGFVQTSPADSGERAGILAVRHPRHAPSELLSALKRHQITAIHRADSIRLSPHFYNTTADLDRVVAAWAELG
ncbi:MAG: aminotransferase class V-fold PLP-dependent enzyme [Fimbriimonadaceae bacterium]|nr:aminotransferase class V-fold PLP-dependent enzyme [Fimbriimonadaceae bacterium]